MPIYRYRAIGNSCDYCREGFEIRQSINAEPLTKCPKCYVPIKKLVSRFHACVIETPEEAISVERKICEYEKKGRWSHAAELADKAGLEGRAKDDYKKAGHGI
jgi:putative FmdB family regulatory protein